MTDQLPRSRHTSPAGSPTLGENDKPASTEYVAAMKAIETKPIYPAGTSARCNRCNQEFTLQVAREGNRMTSEGVARLSQFAICPHCDMMDCHWVYLKDISDESRAQLHDDAVAPLSEMTDANPLPEQKRYEIRIRLGIPDAVFVLDTTTDSYITPYEVDTLLNAQAPQAELVKASDSELRKIVRGIVDWQTISGLNNDFLRIVADDTKPELNVIDELVSHFRKILDESK